MLVKPNVSYSNEKVDFAVSIPLYFVNEEYKFINENNKNNTLEGSGSGIDLTGRMFIQNNGWNIVPSIQYKLMGFSYDKKSYASPSSEEASNDKMTSDSNLFMLGIGVEKSINESNTITIGWTPLILEFITDETNQNDTKNTIDYFKYDTKICLGLESKLSKYFTTRIGADYYTMSTKREESSNLAGASSTNSTYTNSDYSTYLGFAYNYKALTIDAVLNERILLDGTNVISGVSNSMNSMLSIIYNF